MIVPFEQIYEDVNLNVSGYQTPGNRFKPRPTGIVIEDTVNNLVFPIGIPILDTNRVNLPTIFEQYSALYSGVNPTNIMPWHYIMEYLERDYIIYNTRPIDIRYPYSTQEVRELAKDRVILNDETKRFLDSSYEVRNMIHILIIGDSTRDIYTKQLYRKMCDYILSPLARINLFPPVVNNTIFPLNLGPRFLTTVLINTIK